MDSSDSTVFYESDSNNGGQVVLDIEVFDWDAQANPDGIDGEISAIKIESPTLFDPVISIEVNSKSGTSPLSGLYHVVVPNVHPTSQENQQVLITIIFCVRDKILNVI